MYDIYDFDEYDSVASLFESLNELDQETEGELDSCLVDAA